MGTLKAGIPWTAPVSGQDRQGQPFWRYLYVVPLLDDGQLHALGTVYHPLTAGQQHRAAALYARLNQDRSNFGWLTSYWQPLHRRALQRILAEHTQAFSDPLLASLHGPRVRSLGRRLGMALHSQKMRMRTVMARIQINGQTLHQRAEEVSRMGEQQAR